MCDGGARWHGDAPGVGGQCVPVEPTTGTMSTTTSSSSTSSSEEGSSGSPQCGDQVTVRVDTVALAGDGVLEGYPLIVSLTDSALQGAAAIWWTDLDGGVLPHEIEVFDPDTGALRVWVRLPAWTGGEPLELLLRFGQAEHAPANDPAAVWPEGFVAVLHLDDPLTDVLQLDSTATAQHAHAVGGMPAESVVDAVVGPGVAFSGDDDDALEFVDNTFAGTLASSTISIWGRVDSDGTIENPFFSRVNGHNLYPRCRIRPDEDGAVQCQTIVADTPIALRAEASRVPRGEWHHVAITYDASTGLFELYANGEFIVDETMPAEPQGGGKFVPTLGRIDEFGGLLGVLDEFRVVDHPLPAEWIAADERSQRDPASITSVVGPREPAPCP
jgi:hypothetical protein